MHVSCASSHKSQKTVRSPKTGARRGCKAWMWVLITKLQSSRVAATTLNHGVPCSSILTVISCCLPLQIVMGYLPVGLMVHYRSRERKTVRVREVLGVFCESLSARNVRRYTHKVSPTGLIKQNLKRTPMDMLMWKTESSRSLTPTLRTTTN